ncbi:MAG: 1-acyl-sn-glycerol-3-phosphate acyltransferase [Candidatus Omnitrophica bacterium]|nr:1-acyl-sn-glycerol-3-phosphate acyltransferase [Candidatus Omnitrophota bacterium]
MWYWIFRQIIRLILRAFFKLKVEGLENIPKKTNFIVVANHTSFLDPFVIEAVIPKKIHCLALNSLYRKTLIRWFLRLKETIPTGSSSEKAIWLLERNKIVGLFPEGTRSKDGKLKEFRRGVALLALKTGRPILPCAILGTYEAYPPKAKFPKLVPIKVRIGRPIYLLKEFSDLIDDIYLQEGTFKVRNAIKEMLNKE